MSLVPLVLPIIYLMIHSTLVSVSRRKPWRDKARILLINLMLIAGFTILCRLAAPMHQAPHGWQRILMLWGPVVFFWWAYLWSRHTLTALHRPDVSIDKWLIRIEEHIGQPSLNWARLGNRWSTEFLILFYVTYYFYTPVLGLYLDLSGRTADFQAMTAAVCIGYLVSYAIFALVPAVGPRRSLEAEGLIHRSERRMHGYVVTAATNWLMFDGPALKGGAMPSSHSSTAMVFLIWSWRAGGAAVGSIALVVVLGMWLGAVYGRYHFITDVVAGLLLGVGAVLLMDLLIL
jgi:membrane-associated phospholipid phosphatase